MLKLEPMNPTEKPAGARVLNGVWEFLYTGGISPGTLAVQVCICAFWMLVVVIVLAGTPVVVVFAGHCDRFGVAISVVSADLCSGW